MCNFKVCWTLTYFSFCSYWMFFHFCLCLYFPTQLFILNFASMFKKFFHIWYQAWPINDILSHEYFLIFRDGIFNGDLICLIWMVLYVSKMKFQQFFGFTDLFETRVWTYFLSNVHRFWGTVKIIRQFHTFLICSQLLQCKTLVKSADCFMFNLFLL